ncbi:hypothetical protein MKX03_021940, partial [Papaver bracteatum]
MRHVNVSTRVTPPLLSTELELPSAKSKMRMNVEKSGKKMSLIFLTACFVGITSAFLIGYILGIIGGIMFGTGFGNQLFPGIYNLSLPIYGILVCLILAHLYIGGIYAIQVRKKRLQGAIFLVCASGSLDVRAGPGAICVAMGTVLYACGFCLMYQ